MSLWEAKAARSRAWHDARTLKITTAQLYAILGELRRQFGDALYER